MSRQKKIILFGANGMLGRYFHQYLQKDHQVIPVTRRQFDALESNLLDLDNLSKSLGIDSNTIIINCIGMIPQRDTSSSSSSNKYIRVNAEFPLLLNTISLRYQSHFIHITTDCVYN